ncbi:MBL fold metallo-hydrolase [Nitratifractor sp.]
MKLLKTLLILGTLFLGLDAKNLYPLHPVKVAEGIECVIGDFNPPTQANKGFVSNLCWIDLGKSLLIVDAGPTYEFAKEFAELAHTRTGKPIKAVVITNYHDDRLLGASYYADRHIPIIAHESIVGDIKHNPDKFRRLPRLLSKEEFAKTRLVAPDTLFKDRYVVKGSKRSVKLLKLSPVSEEHSDIVVWVPDVKFLFAGNIVFNDRMLNYTKNSDIDGWIEALKKIAALHPRIVLGGHGAKMGPKAYATTLAYLESLKKQVKTAYDKEINLSELMKHLDLHAFDHLKHHESLNRHNAGNYYRQLEWE